jgi:glycosyltransferase involved in cell wall biosynthesis
VGPNLADDDEPATPDADQPAVLALARGPAATAFLDGWQRRAERGDASPLPGSEPAWRETLPGCVRRLPVAANGPYTWTAFDNGVVITDLIRRCYRQLDPAVAAAFGEPFATAGPSFFAWLTSFAGAQLPPLLQAVYDERPDVRFHFPDVAGKDKQAFLHWMVTLGIRDYRFEPALLAAVAAPRQPAASALTAGRYRPVSEPFGVNVLGLLQSEKGVGEHCRATVRALAAAGLPLALNNYVDPGSVNVDTTHTVFSTENPYPINLIHINAVDTPALARALPWYFQGRYNIGYWNWELEWFPEDWRGSFQFFDEIWAPSTFSQQSYQRLSPIPVHWLPIAVALPPAQPRTVRRERFGLARDAFVFLFAFDFHSLFARKNPLAAIEAFRRAFPRRRDVVLALKLHHGDSAPLEFAEVVNACRGQANIRLFREVLRRDEMVGLLRLCDAYVGLHRSEGYGLPLVEAMALGKPVIATNYSGNVDFMNDRNSFPVRYRLVTLDQDYGPYRRGAVWAEPDVDHAAEQMRRVVEQPLLSAEIAARARADVARTLGPQAVGERMRQRLTALMQQRAAARAA